MRISQNEFRFYENEIYNNENKTKKKPLIIQYEICTFLNERVKSNEKSTTTKRIQKIEPKKKKMFMKNQRNQKQKQKSSSNNLKSDKYYNQPRINIINAK